MASSRDSLTLSREELYELAWSKPLTELAKDLGLSDVGLAKRCRKLGVPVPGRGYWARVAAGQEPHRPQLRKRKQEAEARYWDEIALTFPPPSEDRLPDESTARATLREKLAAVPAIASPNLRSASAPVKRTALYLKRPWRGEICWERGERKGPVVSIDVSEALADRALLLAEQLISRAAAIGWPFKTASSPHFADRLPRHRWQSYKVVEPPAESRGALFVEGEPLAIRIDERRDRIAHVETKKERARRARGEFVISNRWDFVPAGELRLHLLSSHGTEPSKTWKDSARTRPEEQVDAVLVELLDTALRIKAERERHRLAELERQRKERLRSELSARRRANAPPIEELEAQAGAWLRARLLRSYVRALRRALGEQRLEAKRQGESIDFLDWAQHYIDQLDPLCSTPHDQDFEEERSSFSSADTKVHEALSRLLGRQWQDAFKIDQSFEPIPTPNPGAIVLGHTYLRAPKLTQRDREPDDLATS